MTTWVRPFLQLAEDVEDRFRRAHYAEEAFTDLALEGLERAGLHRGFDLADLARFGLEGTLPEQHDPGAGFGEPPLTIWHGRRSLLTALVWRSSTTAIHQHAFTGAFQVLAGGSVHARYAYRERASLGEDLGAGTLTCSKIERLGPGDARPIDASDRGIHSLFHLDHPSVSLVLRTRRDLRFAMQHSYLPPGLRVFDAREDPIRERRVQLTRMLARTGRERARAVLREALPKAPAVDALLMLIESAESADLDFALGLFEVARPRFGDLADAIAEALRENDRQRFLLTRRDHVRDPSLRHLLAILMNAPSRKDALTLAQLHVPGRAASDTMTDWVAALAGVKMTLQAGGVPWEPSVFGLPPPDAPSLEALRNDLAGEPPSADGDLPFYEALKKNRSFAILFR